MRTNPDLGLLRLDHPRPDPVPCDVNPDHLFTGPQVIMTSGSIFMAAEDHNPRQPARYPGRLSGKLPKILGSVSERTRSDFVQT